jgi:hypothetical protein
MIDEEAGLISVSCCLLPFIVFLASPYDTSSSFGRLRAVDLQKYKIQLRVLDNTIITILGNPSQVAIFSILKIESDLYLEI